MREEPSRLTLVESIPGTRKALYRCDCGQTKVMYRSNVTSGASRSCGCLVADTNRANAQTRKPIHGHAGTGDKPASKLYSVWKAMKRRCTDKSLEEYPRYGGRGIYVCERWKKFKNFLADMGDQPPGMSIDRIDNDGPYSPENCRWATPFIQNNNRRDNVRITYNGVTKTRSEWAVELGINSNTIKRRQLRGLPVEKILATSPLPTGPKGPRKRAAERA